MNKWNYECETKTSNGYEDCEELKIYTHEYYNALSEEDKEKCVNRIFEIYRSKNIFPITYYNKQGCFDEIQKCIDKEVAIVDNKLTFKYLQGTDLCKFMFPNLFTVQAGTSENNSLYERFMDDHKLKRAIKLVFDMNRGKYVNNTELRNKLELIGGNVATNFHPMKAKAIYEKYCPKNGVIYDMSCGFGGRMLGALTSKNNYKYFGCEPCKETYENLNKLGNLIEEYLDRNDLFKIYCNGSEEDIFVHEIADFAFTSPPYFCLERYSKEDTQCYNKFPNIEDWFDGYVRPTIQNVYNVLKPNCYYAVNIADFNLGKQRIEYVDRWIEISKEIGFEYVETISMKVETRKGVGHNGDKKEGIFVFKK